MKKLRFSCLVLSFFLIGTILFSTDRPVKKIPLQLSFFNEGIGFPLRTVFSDPVHPGISIGTEIKYSDSNNFNFFQALSFGYYYHNYLQHGYFLLTETGIRGIFDFGLMGEALLGVGYLRTFQAGSVYGQNDQGEFVEVTDYGLSRFMPSFSIGIGYDFRKTCNLDFVLILRYSLFLEMPYTSDYQGYAVPALPHVVLSLVIQWYLF